MGPGPLILPAGGDRCVVCHVELEKPLDKEVLVVEASPIVPLPAGVLLQAMAFRARCEPLNCVDTQ